MTHSVMIINISVLLPIIGSPDTLAIPNYSINHTKNKQTQTLTYTKGIFQEIQNYKTKTGGKCVLLTNTSEEERYVRGVINGINIIDGIYNSSECYAKGDSLCLKKISTDFNTLYEFMIYIDNNMETINKTKKIIFWSYYCDDVLTMIKIKQITTEYYNTINQMIAIVNVPENKYIDDSYAKNFILTLRNNNIKGNSDTICCDVDYIKYCIGLINLFGKSQGIFIPYTWVTDIDTVKIIEYYFTTVENYTNDGGIVYSLGDSLDKFNYVWNINQNKQGKTIISVPFSGSMYNNIKDSTRIILDESSSELMYSRALDLYHNNDSFSRLFNDIINGKYVLITDYGHSGKALITVTKLINFLGNKMGKIINWDKVTYLQITSSMDEIEENIRDHLQNEGHPTVVYYNTFLDSYFVNSDRWHGGYNSRCVPRYEVNNWINQPDHVWKNGLLDNYKLCNIHRILLLFQLCCHYTRILNII